MTRLILIAALALSLAPAGLMGYTLANPSPSANNSTEGSSPTQGSTDITSDTESYTDSAAIDTTNYSELEALIERQHRFLTRFHGQSKTEGTGLPAYSSASKTIEAAVSEWLNSSDNSDPSCRKLALSSKRLLAAAGRFASYPDNDSLSSFNNSVDSFNKVASSECLTVPASP